MKNTNLNTDGKEYKIIYQSPMGEKIVISDMGIDANGVRDVQVVEAKDKFKSNVDVLLHLNPQYAARLADMLTNDHKLRKATIVYDESHNKIAKPSDYPSINTVPKSTLEQVNEKGFVEKYKEIFDLNESTKSRLEERNQYLIHIANGELFVIGDPNNRRGAKVIAAIDSNGRDVANLYSGLDNRSVYELGKDLKENYPKGTHFKNGTIYMQNLMKARVTTSQNEPVGLAFIKTSMMSENSIGNAASLLESKENKINKKYAELTGLPYDEKLSVKENKDIQREQIAKNSPSGYKFKP